MLSYIQNALANLKAHKLRVAIAIFWIIVGITSVIVIGSIGNGAKKQMSQSTDSMINNKIVINFRANNESMENMLEFMNPISESDVSKIKLLEGVKKVKAGDIDDYIGGEIEINESRTYVEIYPFNEQGKDSNDGKYQIIHGRDFTQQDENRNVIILNQNSLTELNYDVEKLVGRAVKLNGEMYEVIGIMYADDGVDEFGFYTWNPLSYSSLIPKSTIDKASLINKKASNIYTRVEVEAFKGYDLANLEAQVIDLLSTNHPNIDGYYEKETSDYDMSAEIDMMLSGINKFVMLVTVISMFVGGIGVMNIMYVSVVERKREIGIRRAIGASPGKIIGQFLIESTVITLIGCILGLIVGSIALNFVSSHMPFNAIPTANIYVQAVISSVLTGILSGIVPAVKASKIDPIEAIKG